MTAEQIALSAAWQQAMRDEMAAEAELLIRDQQRQIAEKHYWEQDEVHTKAIERTAEALLALKKSVLP